MVSTTDFKKGLRLLVDVFPHREGAARDEHHVGRDRAERLAVGLAAHLGLQAARSRDHGRFRGVVGGRGEEGAGGGDERTDGRHARIDQRLARDVAQVRIGLAGQRHAQICEIAPPFTRSRAGSRTGVMAVMLVPVSVSVPLAGPAMLIVAPRRTTTASVIRYRSPPCFIDR